MLPDSFQPRNGVVTVTSNSLAPISNPIPQFQGVGDLKTFFEVIEQYATGIPWFFRGEPTQYPNPCLPKFSRPYVDGSANPDDLELITPVQTSANGKNVVVGCMTKQEIEIIEEFKKKAPNDNFFEKMVGADHTGAGWLSFAQHYGEATRLLDITSNPLVALYFACSGQSADDGFVWLYPQPTNVHGTHEIDNFKEAFDPGVGGGSGAQGIAMYKANRMNDFHPPSDVEPLKTPFLLSISAPNKRVIKQSGAFLWCPRPLQELTHNGFVVRISSVAKATLLGRLASYGIDNKGLGF